MRPTRGLLPQDAQLRNHARVLMNISYGDNNSDLSKNIQGWDSQNIVTPITPNTAFSVMHDLGYVPTRFQVVYNNTSGVIYDSGVAWTETSISLKCSVASATIRLFIY